MNDIDRAQNYTIIKKDKAHYIRLVIAPTSYRE